MDNMSSSNLLQSEPTLEEDMKDVSEEISSPPEVVSEEISSPPEVVSDDIPTINLFFTGCKRTEFSFSPTTLLSDVFAFALKMIDPSGSPTDYCLVRTTQHNLPLPLTKSLADISIESGTRLSCMLMHSIATYE